MKATINRYAGKVISVLRQEGLRGGIAKIFNAAFVMLKPIGKGDILFISSGIVGNSSRFRVKNVAEELELNGFKTGIAIQEHPSLRSHVDKFQIFVFHLVNYTPRIKTFIDEIKAAGKEIIFETDDLLFDSENVKQQDFYQRSNALMKKFYENGIGHEFLDDPYVKTCTTTTTFLAEKLRAYGKKVFIVPNKLSQRDLQIASKVVSEKSSKIQNSKFEIRNSIRIGYFSGALSHNKDFASISDALLQIMEKHPNVELVLAGPLDIENVLNKFSTRITQLPYAKREKHFANIASVDINIAPLEIDNPYCTAKSELKYFEAGIVEVPTVATANQTFREAIVDGIDGFLASTSAEWVEKLERLILDEKLRKEMGEKAREKTLTRYTTINAKNEEYYSYLRKSL